MQAVRFAVFETTDLQNLRASAPQASRSAADDFTAASDVLGVTATPTPVMSATAVMAASAAGFIGCSLCGSEE
jgi:hypothetical protein